MFCASCNKTLEWFCKIIQEATLLGVVASRNMEQENFETETEDKNPLFQITALSRYLALTLFILLPFIGGWIGYNYAPIKVVENTFYIKDKSPIRPMESNQLNVTIDATASNTSAWGNTLTADTSALYITNIDPNFGLPGNKISIETIVDSSKNVTIFFSGKEIPVDTFGSKSISFIVPSGAYSGPVYLKDGSHISNTVLFSVSENGLREPKKIIKEGGVEYRADYLIVRVTEEGNTLENAHRLAGIVSGKIIGKDSDLKWWQISIEADSVKYLEILADKLSPDPTVENVVIDSIIEDSPNDLLLQAPSPQ